MTVTKSRPHLKRNLVIAAVLFFVCAAAYLNWSYNARWGEANSAMAEAEDAMTTQANLAAEESSQAEPVSAAVSDYFAEARLTRAAIPGPGPVPAGDGRLCGNGLPGSDRQRHERHHRNGKLVAAGEQN